MDDRLVNLIYGSLLHDIGKVIHRTGENKSHSYLGWDFLKSQVANSPFVGNDDIRDCIAYHHGRELASARSDGRIGEASLAYISYIADNISAAGDRRKEYIEGDPDDSGSASGGAIFDKTAPLASVFNILNGDGERQTYPFAMLEGINYPTADHKTYTAGDYAAVKTKLQEQLATIDVDASYINSLLHLLEVTTSYVPSSTNTQELMDISLYDHSKTTAAIASCLYYYLGETSDYTRLLTDESRFKEEGAFLLFSCDMSGIQNFIYTISGTDAAKSLRGRSLYLELLLENVADEILGRLGLSRANLLYTGGGHSYMLLANTQQTKEILDEIDQELRDWFLENYQIALYIASAYTECTSRELAEEIGQVYARVSRNLSVKKAQRYSVDDIKGLNDLSKSKAIHDRECKECKLTGPTDDKERCDICRALIGISPEIIKDKRYFAVIEEGAKGSVEYYLPLPFGQILTIVDLEAVRGGDQIRVYSKNDPSMGSNYSTNIWVGDYAFSMDMARNKAITFGDLAAVSKGFDRIAVLRADVDNLGRAFISGFKEQKDGVIVPNSQKKYETISRTSTLSRQLSLFFKYHINQILRKKKRQAVIIYSGGDDMFIVGAWDDIIDLAGDINRAFGRYSQGKLTMSAGIGIYNPTYPIARIAYEVGELENAAKTKDEKKNKVTLFKKAGHQVDDRFLDDWVLTWDELPTIASQNADATVGSQSSIEEKLNYIRRTFSRDQESGKALLYNILSLLRESRRDRINVARYAYLLARAKQRNKAIDEKQMYQYILDKEEQRDLEIAITIYSYESRNQ